MSSAPKAPDPYATAAAQTQSNQATAAYNADLNRVSTYTPYGNLVYSQNGVGPSGAPQYSANVSLTPASQAQLDTQQAQDTQIAKLGLGLTDQIGNQINTPLSDQATSNDAARAAYYNKETAFLDPQYNNMQNDLEAKLANQGVVQGSDAWNRAQDELGRQRTLAYGQAQDSAILNGQQAQAQALANGITLKNQPINQLSALRSGTQIQNPTFPNVPGSNAAGTDVAGQINSAYQNQLSAYNNQMSGLMGIGSALASAIPFSDRRLKTAIKRIGKTPVMGLPLYAFRYLGGKFNFVGVMAQDVLKVKPEAVLREADGYMRVNYGMLA